MREHNGSNRALNVCHKSNQIPENSINSSLAPSSTFPSIECDSLVFGKRPHNAEQSALRFEPDTRNLRQLDVAVFYRYPVSKSTERLKNSWIRLVASQPQTCSDVQRHLVPSMRNAADRRPTILLQHPQNSKVFGQAVAQST